MNRGTSRFFAAPREERFDPAARRVRDRVAEALGMDTGAIATATAYTICPALPAGVARELVHTGLGDTILFRIEQGDPPCPSGATRFIAVDRLPGVTDDRASTLSAVLSDLWNDFPESASVHVRDVYWLKAELDEASLRSIAERVIGNPLVESFEIGSAEQYAEFVASEAADHAWAVRSIRLDVEDDELVSISDRRLLSLSLEEMTAIAAHYRDPSVLRRRRAVGLDADATYVELEILAQTWSEHCKHKEFRAVIEYRGPDAGGPVSIDSLFRTYIEGATLHVAETLGTWGYTWLLKVFNDNAGVVRYDDASVFVWKVETHNSPSALDPYGGAITGILGNNRDPFGTGIGGGRLLFNTDVLCFGSPDYDKPLLDGQLHPLRVFRGVRKGIEDGGNQSGVPTVNGAIVFDDRYAGKPLVYCGTGAVAPDSIGGRPWWEKRIDCGDRIVMAGGRVGKDGIHGATFSSAQLDSTSPRSAVQIGSPMTQKLLFDFVDDACRRGLIKCCTDNGAGGLSSSVGELAELAGEREGGGGADVDTSLVPLKYPGLDPWEIFVSESQERMTLVVEPGLVEDLLDLAGFYEVEATDIGRFSDSGELVVRHGEAIVACLPLEFLHHGVPRKRLTARWKRPESTEPEIPEGLDHGAFLRSLLADVNVCSREPVIRQYDHEVQAGTVVKPLMGPQADGPQDAAVLRPDPDSPRGIAVSNGIAPRYADLDPYQAAAGALDEAVRGIVAVGGRLPGPEHPLFWSINDNFCVPNSVYDPQSNPDGREKLGALVRMCQATYDVATAYAVPLTSGKDSMKNDFHADGQTISVPPTVLFSASAGIADVRRSVTTPFKAVGDRIYLLGETYDELGASVFYRLLGERGANVPVVRVDRARALYESLAQATASQVVASCHDLSEGGLAVAVAECAIGGRLGCDIDIDRVAEGIGVCAALYAESHSRFLVSVPPSDVCAFESLLGSRSTFLGEVTNSACIVIGSGGQTLVDLPLDQAVGAWKSGLEGIV